MKPYTSKAKKAIDLAVRISKKMNYSYVGTEHILAGLIKEGTGVAAEILTACNVEYDKLISMIEDLISPGDNIEVMDRDGYSPRTQRVLERASEEADRFECNEIGTEHLLMAIVLQGDCAAARLLNTMGVNSQKMFIDILGAMGEDPSAYRNLMKSYNTSYNSATPVLDQYSRDLTDMAEAGLLDPVIGRKKEMERVIQILCRRGKNNPCLIGEPGVGKTAIVEGLAQDIVSGNVPDILLGKRLVSLDMSGLVAKSKYRGEFEERIKNALDEVKKDGNVILFIDEIHTITSAGESEGAMNAGNILKPALSRGEIQVIGATTFTEYRKYIEKDQALERRFQPVRVEEPSVADTLAVMNGIKRYYEQYHHVQVPAEVLSAVVTLSERYITDRFLPDKAIDLLDEACACCNLAHPVISEYLGMQKELDALKQEEAEMESADVNEAIDYERVAERKTRIAKLVADLLSVAGIDRQITMDLHADQIQGFFDIPVDHLNASAVFMPYIQSLKLEDLVIATPDVGGSKRASAFSNYLGVPLVLCNKSREKANEVASMQIIGDVKDKNVVLVDDIVDTAGTITKAADIMLAAGAKSVRAIASHCVMSDPASFRVQESGLTEMVFTDSIPYSKKCAKVKQLSIADMFAETIRRVVNNESISSQYLI